MGRNNKQTADYFPHYIGSSRTKFILEQRWHNDGYAFWFKLLELLCAADGQYYDCWTKINWDYLIAVTGVSSETAEEKKYTPSIEYGPEWRTERRRRG